VVAFQQWLEDGSLQIFGGHRLKEELFHRIQRVARSEGQSFQMNLNNFFVRRVNLTFRFVPENSIYSFSELPRNTAEQVRIYIEWLVKGSAYFAAELQKYKLAPGKV
jgi:hypothetical protein